MLPRVVLRFQSTAATVQRHSRRPKWVVGAVAAGVLGGSWLASSWHESNEDAAQDEQASQGALGRLRQQLAMFWPSSSGHQQQQPSQSITATALAHIKATASRWLARKAEDPESREALLAFGSSSLLDFLVTTATEDSQSPEQQHAEQAVVNFLGGHHTATRLLARPGAVPHLLQHIASGRASPQLTGALQSLLADRAADFSQGLSLDDARQAIQLLQRDEEAQGGTVQGLTLQLLTAWCEAGRQQRAKLCSLGVAPALGGLAMQAVAQGDSGRELQGAVCRLQRLLLLDPGQVTDAELASWMQPLLFLAADAAAAAAAAAASAASGGDSGAVGGGMLGSSAGAADLALADAAMTTLAAAVASGGPLVKEALKGLHWLPTLDCLALSPDPAIKARAAAALAALVTAGQLDSQEAQLRWRDMLLGWLGGSTAHLLTTHSSSDNRGSRSTGSSWLWGLLGDSSGGGQSGGSSLGKATAADEALATSCVAALKALAQQEGPVGLSVAQLWLSQLLQQLSSRVAAYTSITQLAQSPELVAAAAVTGLLPTTAKADASPGTAFTSQDSSSGSGYGNGSGGPALVGRSHRPESSATGSTASSSWQWWGSTNNSSGSGGATGRSSSSSSPAGSGIDPADAATAYLMAASGKTSDTSSWYWPFGSGSGSNAPSVQPQGVDNEHGATLGAAAPAAGSAALQTSRAAADASATLYAELDQGTSSSNDLATAEAAAGSDQEAVLESARASIWRDAAPVTAASARAAADELRAAAHAMLTAWLGAAGSLNLPSDLLPGMFAPAVVEAYPQTARVIDFSVAQQRTCKVLELLASVVAEDPTKQAWLLSAGILPVMERLALHDDAQLEPQAFVAKYSSSSRSDSSGTESSTAADSDAPDSSGSSLSLSARIGRSFWGWRGKGSSGGSDNGSTSATGSSIATTGKALPAGAVGLAIESRLPHSSSYGSDTTSCQTDGVPVVEGEAVHPRQTQQQPQVGPGVSPADDSAGSLLLMGLLAELDFSSNGSSSSHPAAAAAVVAAGGRLADALQARFTAAALASPRGTQQERADTAEQAQKQPHAAPAGSAALLMEFAQGAAGWSDVDSRHDASTSLAGGSTPQALGPDDAAAITAAAEEGASWGDGDGLTVLCLQRQVARILSMLALQPAAAQQLTDVAQQLPGGAAELLQGLSGYAALPRHLQHRGTGPAGAPSLHPTGGSGRTGVPPVEPLQHSAAASASVSAAVAPAAAWLPWLLEAAASDDCLLSSYATKALLHLEAAVAYSGGCRRRQRQQQQQQQQHTLLQQPGQDQAQDKDGSSSGSGWRQRLVDELRASEELLAFVEGLLPLGGASGSERSAAFLRPPVVYPDGVHLMHPADSHNWGVLQPPPVSLMHSLSAAAASAASAAAAAAASDLSQSDIDTADRPPAEPPVLAVTTAATAVANAAAAAAAAAAAGALGADTSQLSSSSSSSSSSTESSVQPTAGQGAAEPSAVDVGFLQPAVSWLAHKLVQFAAIKEEEVQQALQDSAAAAAAQPPANPAAPLSTYAALQALLSKEQHDQGSSESPAAQPAGEPQQLGQQDGTEEMQQPAPPELDIVFIHGIRGGPFVSWRKGLQRLAGSGAAATTDLGAGSPPGHSAAGSKRKGVALKASTAAAVHRRHMTQEECWPAAWLAADVPGARLLTVEYKAPVTGWEGESLSLPDCGRLLLDKLVAAGVGQRPVVFVAHSMGGLIVKEMLSQALDEPPSSRRGRLASATRALAFYATPHFGSGMAALGWKLRHLPGASPAPSIHHLSPGPHLAALNTRLAALHATGRVSVLSLCEGLATNLAGLDFMPRILIVPFESAYPGFGEVHVLQEEDHITVCKPRSREAPGYSLLLEFVRASMARAAADAAEAAAKDKDGGAAEERAVAAAEAAAASS